MADIIKRPEILAPAGSADALKAAVYCGASAVYLGGRSFNARRNAANFSEEELSEAVSFCHVRGVKVYQTINTIVFDSELRELEKTLSYACSCGVDGIIVQDLAVAEIARKCAPSMPLHASTQMSVHNLEGVRALERLGFSRAVLARELSRREIEHISREARLEIECFVHGALCMCVSGQCYLSSMIGGRSGNRGLCAQPCRLPFSSAGSSYALSLKDLSLVERLRDMASIGVKSFKIEGRLKRPEYVAAAVTACRQVLDGEKPDMGLLRAVFSRSGFTDGYYRGNLGDGMFGVRVREDIAPAAALKELSALYAREGQTVPVNMRLCVKKDERMLLSVMDNDGNTVNVNGPPPEKAENAATTPERASALLGRTGGTPFYADKTECEIGEALMSPASALGAMRREALENLAALRGAVRPHGFTPYDFGALSGAYPACPDDAGRDPRIRVRLQSRSQASPALLDKAGVIILPAAELEKTDAEITGKYREKIYMELPRVIFGEGAELELALKKALELGVSHAVAGNIGGIEAAGRLGFEVHGDFGLNAANSLALDMLAEMGLCDMTLSFELGLKQALAVRGKIPRGIIAYGYLPLMITRNSPAGTGGAASPYLTDRLGNKFRLRRAGIASNAGAASSAWEMYNTVPLVLSDKINEMRGFDFITLYFTNESAEECLRVLGAYENGETWDAPKTRGLYYRKVV